jgi:hypothetical protein
MGAIRERIEKAVTGIYLFLDLLLHASRLHVTGDTIGKDTRIDIHRLSAREIDGDVTLGAAIGRSSIIDLATEIAQTFGDADGAKSEQGASKSRSTDEHGTEATQMYVGNAISPT